jgi:ethanolamine ammonia-lyase small subunit
MAQHNRVLLVFSPSMRDARLEAQRQTMARFASNRAGARSRAGAGGRRQGDRRA